MLIMCLQADSEARGKVKKIEKITKPKCSELSLNNHPYWFWLRLLKKSGYLDKLKKAYMDVAGSTLESNMSLSIDKSGFQKPQVSISAADLLKLFVKEGETDVALDKFIIKELIEIQKKIFKYWIKYSVYELIKNSLTACYAYNVYLGANESAVKLRERITLLSYKESELRDELFLLEEELKIVADFDVKLLLKMDFSLKQLEEFFIVNKISSIDLEEIDESIERQRSLVWNVLPLCSLNFELFCGKPLKEKDITLSFSFNFARLMDLYSVSGKVQALRLKRELLTSKRHFDLRWKEIEIKKLLNELQGKENCLNLLDSKILSQDDCLMMVKRLEECFLYLGLLEALLEKIILYKNVNGDLISHYRTAIKGE